MSVNQDTPGMSYALSELGVKGNPDLAIVDARRLRGGGWSVDTLANRDLIPADVRKADVTRCYVRADGKTYVLRSGIDNSNWVSEADERPPVDQLVRLVADQPAIVGQAFSLSLPLDLFGPFFSIGFVSNMPPGLGFDQVQHTVFGTPTQAGNYAVVVDYLNTRTGKYMQYIFCITVAIGNNTGPTATIVLNSFLPMPLQCRAGQAFSFDIPQDLFRSSSGHAVQVFAVDGLPGGLSYNASTSQITGTATDPGRYTVVLEAQDTMGGMAQYTFVFIVNAANSNTAPTPTSTPASTVGAANIDLVFDPLADDPNNPTHDIHYDYNLALQLTEPGTNEVGTRAIPGAADTRYIGQKSISSAVAIAALGSSQGNNNRHQFYRFAISLAVLRSLYPSKTYIAFGVYGARKSINPGDTANNKIGAVTINRTKTSGIVAKTAGNNIDFTTNGDALTPITDSTGWMVGVSERFLFTVTANLSTGELVIGTVSTGNAAPTVANHEPSETLTVGTAVSHTLAANEFADSDGTIASVAVTGLPPGLSYDAPSRTISGTPTQAGTYTVSITATDNGGATVTDSVTFTVNANSSGPYTQNGSDFVA